MNWLHEMLHKGNENGREYDSSDHSHSIFIKSVWKDYDRNVNGNMKSIY